jgi:hypothetical protein
MLLEFFKNSFTRAHLARATYMHLTGSMFLARHRVRTPEFEVSIYHAFGQGKGLELFFIMCTLGHYSQATGLNQFTSDLKVVCISGRPGKFNADLLD